MAQRHSVFVPNEAAGSRRDTAVLLVGTAREFGIDQHDIRSAHRGFYVTEALADLIYAEVDEDEDDTESKSTETSGNRAEKKKQSHEKGK